MNDINVLNQIGISYIVKKGNYKRITIGYYHKNYLTIKVPINLPSNKLEQFINDNVNWIKNKQPKGYFIETKYCTGEKYLFLGKEYEMLMFTSKHPLVELLKNQLIIYTPSMESEIIKKSINKWRLKQAEFIFQEVLNKCFQEMSNYLSKYPILEIKRYKARWGCCYPQNNKIIINISVVNLPIELIEYVIYHELAHFIYLNHGKEFYSFLTKFVPNERLLKKQITMYNPLYE